MATVGNVSGTSGGGTSLSVSAPGGSRAWDLVVATQRTVSNFAQPEPEPLVTSAATLLATSVGDARGGEHRFYASSLVSPVTASYSSMDDIRAGLVAVGIVGGSTPSPADFVVVGDSISTTGAYTFTVSPPVGTEVGDLLFVSLCAGKVSQTNPTLTFQDPGLTPIVQHNLGAGPDCFIYLYYRVATAADAAGTTSYSVTINANGGVAGGSLVMLGGVRGSLILRRPVVGYIGPGLIGGGPSGPVTNPAGTASSPNAVWNSNVAARAYDRNATTWWQPTGGSTSSTKTWQLAFTDPQTIQRVVITFYDTAHMFLDYVVETSEDGSAWAAQQAVVGNASAMPVWEPATPVENVTHLRLRGTRWNSSDVANYGPAIRDVEVTVT